jgi:hypothetical protein
MTSATTTRRNCASAVDADVIVGIVIADFIVHVADVADVADIVRADVEGGRRGAGRWGTTPGV